MANEYGPETIAAAMRAMNDFRVTMAQAAEAFRRGCVPTAILGEMLNAMDLPDELPEHEDDPPVNGRRLITFEDEV